MAIILPADYVSRGTDFRFSPSTKSTISRQRYCKDVAVIVNGACSPEKIKTLLASATINNLVACNPYPVLSVSMRISANAGGGTLPDADDAQIKTLIDDLWNTYLASFTCP